MASLTASRSPHFGRGRTVTIASTEAISTDTGEKAPVATTIGTPGATLEADEARALRTRRIATIVAGSLLVAAVVSGAATVIARQVARRGAARNDALG